MTGQRIVPSLEELVLGNEDSWDNLYDLLRPQVTLFVHVFATPSWLGQEHDFVQDVLQETALRLYKTLLMASTTTSIRNLESFCITVARNYCRDLRRKDRRLLHFPPDPYTFDARIHPYISEDLLETTLDELTLKTILAEIALFILAMPEKRRSALLVDLARLSDFEDEPSGISLALAQVGITLSDYQHRQPTNAAERTRHNALVSLAYRGLHLTFHAKYSEAS